ncbi:hypothetical protein [Nodularia chucula]|uniref:hypothetical protein n=1 Tax=Nodularia chucula TaxID=3093667 RepID=UPI0039C63CA6
MTRRDIVNYFINFWLVIYSFVLLKYVPDVGWGIIPFVVIHMLVLNAIFEDLIEKLLFPTVRKDDHNEYTFGFFEFILKLYFFWVVLTFFCGLITQFFIICSSIFVGLWVPLQLLYLFLVWIMFDKYEKYKRTKK